MLTPRSSTSLALVLSGGACLLAPTAAAAWGTGPAWLVLAAPVVTLAVLGGWWPGLLATLATSLGAQGLSGLPGGPASGAWWLPLFGGGLSLLAEWRWHEHRRQVDRRLLLEAVVHGTSDAVFIKDLQGRYELINEAGARFMGQAVPAVLGRDDGQLFDAESAQTVRAADAAVLAAGQVSTHHEFLRTGDGLPRTFLVTKGPVRNRHGQVRGLFGISRDITDHERALLELARSEVRLSERERQLERVLEGSDQGYWDWDIERGQFDVSDRFITMLGYRPGELDLSLERWPELVHPEDWPLVQESLRRHLRGDSPAHQLELRARTADGGWRWLLTRGRIVERADDGRALRMAGTHTDIEERKRLEQAQREAGAVFEHSLEGIMVVSAEGTIVRVNPAFSRITGYSAEEVLGQRPSLLSSGEHTAGFYAAMWRSVLDHGQWRGEVTNRRRDGELFVELLTISAVRNAQGDVEHYIGVFTDVTALKRHAAELDAVAHYDSLTRLPNRRLLSDRLAQAIARSSRTGRPTAVAYLDLDGFKGVNDRLGMAAGDQVLQRVADLLRQELRGDDTLARLGGDEFAIILPAMPGVRDIELVLGRIVAALDQPLLAEEPDLRLGASLGVTLYPDDDVDADTLLRHADQAMVMAKAAGGHRFQLFDPEAERQSRNHRRQQDLLREALAQGEFLLHYQPKVDLDSGALVGVEALIRWQHPTRGLLLPGEFLHAVQGGGLEGLFGDWVIETALRQLDQWQAQGRLTAVSVNIDARHLLQPDFEARLRAALARHTGLPPGLLMLEVLESAAISDLDRAIEVLGRCRALGVRLSLDDFGTGHSSLTYLRQLPVDELKIDRGFVRDVLTDPGDRAIVQGVVQLAGLFHRQVVAEGVESMAHGAALRAMGCRLAQGFGIGRPMAPQALWAWHEEWLTSAPWLVLAEDSSVLI